MPEPKSDRLNEAFERLNQFLEFETLNQLINSVNKMQNDYVILQEKSSHKKDILELTKKVNQINSSDLSLDEKYNQIIRELEIAYDGQQARLSPREFYNKWNNPRNKDTFHYPRMLASILKEAYNQQNITLDKSANKTIESNRSVIKSRTEAKSTAVPARPHAATQPPLAAKPEETKPQTTEEKITSGLAKFNELRNQTSGDRVKKLRDQINVLQECNQLLLIKEGLQKWNEKMAGLDENIRILSMFRQMVGPATTESMFGTINKTIEDVFYDLKSIAAPLIERLEKVQPMTATVTPVESETTSQLKARSKTAPDRMASSAKQPTIDAPASPTQSTSNQEENIRKLGAIVDTAHTLINSYMANIKSTNMRDLENFKQPIEHVKNEIIKLKASVSDPTLDKLGTFIDTLEADLKTRTENKLKAAATKESPYAKMPPMPKSPISALNTRPDAAAQSAQGSIVPSKSAPNAAERISPAAKTSVSTTTSQLEIVRRQIISSVVNNRSDEAINLLKANLGEVNLVDGAGFSLLHNAIHRNNNSLVEFLLKNGADANKKIVKPTNILAHDKTPLEYATFITFVRMPPLMLLDRIKSFKETIDLLLKNGAQPSEKLKNSIQEKLNELKKNITHQNIPGVIMIMNAKDLQEQKDVANELQNIIKNMNNPPKARSSTQLINHVFSETTAKQRTATVSPTIQSKQLRNLEDAEEKKDRRDVRMEQNDFIKRKQTVTSSRINDNILPLAMKGVRLATSLDDLITKLQAYQGKRKNNAESLLVQVETWKKNIDDINKQIQKGDKTEDQIKQMLTDHLVSIANGLSKQQTKLQGHLFAGEFTKLLQTMSKDVNNLKESLETEKMEGPQKPHR